MCPFGWSGHESISFAASLVAKDDLPPDLSGGWVWGKGRGGRGSAPALAPARRRRRQLMERKPLAAGLNPMQNICASGAVKSTETASSLGHQRYPASHYQTAPLPTAPAW